MCFHARSVTSGLASFRSPWPLKRNHVIADPADIVPAFRGKIVENLGILRRIAAK
jgi:hypothetical protein